MKKEFLLIVLFTGLMIQAMAQNLNSGLSLPVVLDTKNPVVEVISPNGGETFEIGQSITIYWNASDDHLPEFPVKIGFSTIYGGLPVWLEDSFSNADTATVLLPQVETYFAKVFVKLTDAFGNTTTDESNGYFTISSGCELPIADAGSNATICENGVQSLIDATAENYSSISWTTTGDGIFNDQNIVNPNYTPGTGDNAAGNVNLCLLALPVSPCTISSEDCMALIIQKPPVAYAGPDATICEGGTCYTLSFATGENYSEVQWFTTTGGGFFDNESSLNPTYCPSPIVDYTQGTIEIGLSLQSINPCTLYREDYMNLSFQSPPTADAGLNTTNICYGDSYTFSDATAQNYSKLQWFTLNGGGFFDDESILHPTYYPSPTVDYPQQCIIIGINAQAINPCVVSAEDFMDLCFAAPPVAFAGAPMSLCSDVTPGYTFADAVVSVDVNYGGDILWTTAGDGTFDDASIQNPTYTFGQNDLLGGTIDFTLTVTGVTCEPVVSTNQIDITVAPIAYAGADATITENPEYTLLDASAGNYNSFIWATDGDGTFNNSLEINTVYLAGQVDVEDQCVNLTLTAFPVSPCTLFAQDTIQLCFIKLVTNVAPTQRTDGSKMVDIYYDLSSLGPSYNITAEVSFEGNGNYIQIDSVTGDIGNNIPAGTNKQIVWNAGHEALGISSDNAIFRIIANYEGLWQCGDSLIDTRDGHKYSTVQIGTQCWMKQNLNVGTRIDGLTNQTNNGTIEKFCNNDSEVNCDAYGGLYQWDEMMQYSTMQGVQGICPPGGWHLSTDVEWTALANYLGGADIAGGKIKSTGTIEEGTGLWYSPNAGATNSSGFTALPGGNFQFNEGTFANLGGETIFWTSTQEDAWTAWRRTSANFRTNIGFDNDGKFNGFSVRCLKDNFTPINQPPSSPNSPSPETGSTNQPLNTTLTWNCTDPENDPMTFDAYFGVENPPTLVSTAQAGMTYNPGLLASNTDYFWKVVAHDNQGNTTEGPVWSFTTLSEVAWQCGDALIDTRDNQSYSTVQIGTQCWMRQNLNIGTRIAGTGNQMNNDTIEKYCYENTEANCTTYGGLYQWNEMMQYSATEGIKGICLTGWHLPTDSEWTTLTNYLGGEGVAGGKMKESGTTHWNSPNTGATNSSGFTGLPGGNYSWGSFSSLGSYGVWWSSTANSSDAWFRFMTYYSGEVNRTNASQTNGFSVRCVRD
jgi:uncharacterized protein (TIGR02145 family)